jgi:hypothetical protein
MWHENCPQQFRQQKFIQHCCCCSLSTVFGVSCPPHDCSLLTLFVLLRFLLSTQRLVKGDGAVVLLSPSTFLAAWSIVASVWCGPLPSRLQVRRGVFLPLWLLVLSFASLVATANVAELFSVLGTVTQGMLETPLPVCVSCVASPRRCCSAVRFLAYFSKGWASLCQ